VHLDLHVHTTCSDGQLAPEAVAAQARRAGLHAIAITDHDTTAGVAPARAAGEALGLRVIAGIELSCNRDGREMHLLGYGIDPDHPAIAAITARLGALRRERVGTIIDRLCALGVTIRREDVLTPAGNVSVGRPHVADAMVRVGAVRHQQEAFSRYLADGGPAYVPSRGPDVADAIVAVRAAGGCSVWAHPALDDAPLFPRLRAMGLDGVEVLRPNLAPTSSSALEHAAREAGLVTSGGSDWHGGNPPLGSWYVTHRHVGALLDRLGIMAE
jgi:predicted metal-dependent phosphoesterase TrpH